MIRLLPVPGLQTLAEYDVAVFPGTRPVDGHIVAVWNDDGEYQGLFRAVESINPGNGIKLVSVASAREITSNCDPVYWTYQKDSGPVAKNAGPAFEIIGRDDVKPGDKIEMFDAWWNVRYINYYAHSKRFQLQREEDELHPLCDKTCLTFEAHDGLHIRIKRMLPGGRHA